DGAPPLLLNVLLERGAERAVVPRRTGSAVDLTGLEHEAAVACRRDDFIEAGLFGHVGVSLQGACGDLWMRRRGRAAAAPPAQSSRGALSCRLACADRCAGLLYAGCMSDAPPTPDTATSRRWVAPIVTVVAATVLNALCLPVWFLLVLASGRYDASGAGGPFRSCTPDSVSCDGPSVFLIVAASLALVAIAALAGWLGDRKSTRLNSS